MENLTLKSITIKTIVVHSITYFLMGVIAMFVMDYATLFETPVLKVYMRPIDDPMVRAGILFQPLRGLLFGLVFYTLRELIFTRKDGWKTAGLMLVVVGILSTFGPTPGSIEGFIYTQVPFWSQIRGMPEIIIQALLLAYITHYWVTHSEIKWLPRTLVIVFILLLTMMVLGILFAP